MIVRARFPIGSGDDVDRADFPLRNGFLARLLLLKTSKTRKKYRSHRQRIVKTQKVSSLIGRDIYASLCRASRLSLTRSVSCRHAKLSQNVVLFWFFCSQLCRSGRRLSTCSSSQCCRSFRRAAALSAPSCRSRRSGRFCRSRTSCSCSASPSHLTSSTTRTGEPYRLVPVVITRTGKGGVATVYRPTNLRDLHPAFTAESKSATNVSQCNWNLSLHMLNLSK